MEGESDVSLLPHLRPLSASKSRMNIPPEELKKVRSLRDWLAAREAVKMLQASPATSISEHRKATKEGPDNFGVGNLNCQQPSGTKDASTYDPSISDSTRDESNGRGALDARASIALEASRPPIKIHIEGKMIGKKRFQTMGRRYKKEKVAYEEAMKR